jgi:hypothetical protein
MTQQPNERRIMNRHANYDKATLDTRYDCDAPSPAVRTTKLDTVITVAIGDVGPAGQLSPGDWLYFQDEVRATLDKYATVVAQTSGQGLRSDDELGPDGNLVTPGHDIEQTAVFVAINPHDIELGFRRDLARILKRYGQTSACFAIDPKHEPVFTTPDGYRPQVHQFDAAR